MTATPKPVESDEKQPPSPSLLARIERATIEGAAKLLGMPEVPMDGRVHHLKAAEENQLREIEEGAIAKFHGELPQLEAALGMLRMGYHFGWKVLYIIHSKKTIRNYEEILGIKIREVFPPDGPSSERSVGYVLAGRFPNFWKVVGGDIKIPRRKDLAP